MQHASYLRPHVAPARQREVMLLPVGALPSLCCCWSARGPLGGVQGGDAENGKKKRKKEKGMEIISESVSMGRGDQWRAYGGIHSMTCILN